MLGVTGIRRAAILIFLVTVATIAGAWIFEYFGYAPCDLCLKQRWAYYAAIPLALCVVLLADRARSMARIILLLLALIWAASTIFGIYHAGIEWKWWPGPSTCTGGGGLTTGLPDLTAHVVLCDQAAIRIFGLSLAGWNALISFALMLVAGRAYQGSSSVSQ